MGDSETFARKSFQCRVQSGLTPQSAAFVSARSWIFLGTANSAGVASAVHCRHVGYLPLSSIIIPATLGSGSRPRPFVSVQPEPVYVDGDVVYHS